MSAFTDLCIISAISWIVKEFFSIFPAFFPQIGAFSWKTQDIVATKEKAPLSERPSSCLAAAAVVIAAAVIAAVVAAEQAVTAAAAGKQNDQNDDPPAAVAAPTIVTHKEYLHEIDLSCLDVAHSMV